MCSRVWMCSTQAAVKSDKKLAEFLDNPLVNKTLKKQAIEEGLKKLNYNPLTVNMLGAMAENGRMRYADAVFSAFSKIMSAERGEVLCEVTTAKVGPLPQLDFDNQPLHSYPLVEVPNPLATRRRQRARGLEE